MTEKKWYSIYQTQDTHSYSLVLAGQYLQKYIFFGYLIVYMIKLFKEIARPKGRCKKNEKWEWEPRKKLICIKENKFHLEGKLRGNLRDTKLMKYIMA